MSIPFSPYYDPFSLADGVYAAVGKVNSPAFSNAGIIDTGDHTLIFDTFNIVEAAHDLRRTAENLTGRQADFVIISHSHSDHWGGNQVFANHADILTTTTTNEALAEWVGEFKEIKRDPSEYETYIGEIEKNLAQAKDERLRQHLSWVLIIERHQLKTLATFKPCLPKQTFDGHISFHGSKRTVELCTPGPGHTDSDIILKLPTEKIAFIGDLGFFKTHPYLGSSTPEKWTATLDELAASEIETFIPGHGPVGTKQDVLALKDYILACKKLAAEVVQSGGCEEEAASQPMPDFSKDWAGFGRFERTMRFLYQQEKKNE
jgi:cyclase